METLTTSFSEAQEKAPISETELTPIEELLELFKGPILPTLLPSGQTEPLFPVFRQCPPGVTPVVYPSSGNKHDK